MLTHKQIWDALDTLARTYTTSPSALAKKAGLDPTTFNISKRVSPNGKDRWPSTESISKVLHVVGIDFEEFAALAINGKSHGPAIPVIGLAQAGDDGYFDDAGYPVGEGWDEVRVPGMKNENAFALEIQGDSMHPVFRDGDRVVVAPHETVRKGDRVVVKTTDGEIMAKELSKQTTTKVDLISINADHADRTFKRDDIEWMARIVWVSQ